MCVWTIPGMKYLNVINCDQDIRCFGDQLKSNIVDGKVVYTIWPKKKSCVYNEAYDCCVDTPHFDYFQSVINRLDENINNIT